MPDNVLLVFQNLGKVALKHIVQLLLIHCHGVGAACTIVVVAGANPADVGILVCPDGTPEGPAALLTFNDGGEGVFVALPGALCLELPAPLPHDTLGLFEGLLVDNTEVGAFHHHPLLGVPLHPLAGQEIGDLLLPVDDLAGVQLVGQHMANAVLVPGAVPFRFQSPLIEHGGDFGGTVPLAYIPLEDLAQNRRFLLVDGQIEVVAVGLVVAVDEVGDSPLLGVHLFAEFDALGGVGALLLRHRPQQGQDEFAVAHAGHVGCEKLSLDAQLFQASDVLQQVHRVSGEAGDVLHHDKVKQSLFSVRHHAEEFLAVLDLSAGDALIGVEADEMVAGALDVFVKEAFLHLKAVELVFFVRGDSTVGGNVHG